MNSFNSSDRTKLIREIGNASQRVMRARRMHVGTLALGQLLRRVLAMTQLVALAGLLELHFTVGGHFEPLGGGLLCLQLRHKTLLFLLYDLCNGAITTVRRLPSSFGGDS